MKRFITLYIFAIVLLLTSTGFSQEGIRGKRDVDSPINKFKQHHSTKSTPREKGRELDAVIPSRRWLGGGERFTNKDESIQQLRHNPAYQEGAPDSVNTAWVRSYASGLAPGWDAAEAITVDNSGNVYVTGSSTVISFGTEIHTIKYNSAGAEIWNAGYSYGLGSENAPTAIGVDQSGNVYVTGSTDGSGVNEDYITIKYDANGNTIWVRPYNGPGNSFDMATALVVDSSGNVYVTGTSYGSGTSTDYATIKYDGSGDTVWIRRYNGPRNSSDRANALVVDGWGNVYVTGFSTGSENSDQSDFAQSEYATIKYDANGDTVWVRRYNGPGDSYNYAEAIAVDNSGNVFVAGTSDASVTSFDYCTIKYTADGDTAWVRRYNGPYNSNDWATALTVDSSGNAYVTGTSDHSNNDGDFLTIKYTANGDTVWVRLYNGAGNLNDGATALAVDGSGNVFVTGYSDGLDGNDNYATIKYKENGDTVWIRLYDGPGNSSDYVSGFAIDSYGNVYITGSSDGSGTDADYATIKYDAGGDTTWVRRYNGQGRSDDAASALAVDGSGNVYVTGSSFGFGTGWDYATIKYNVNGDTVWIRRYNGTGNSNDKASALAVDGSGNVYVTGYSMGSGTYKDYATIKYNLSGDTVWVRRYNGPKDNDVATALAIDCSGNVYVTGYSFGLDTRSDYATIKYNTSGDTVWVRRYSRPGYSKDAATALAVDSSGNVYVTGYSMGSDTSFDYTTIKYNASGDTVWVRRYNGPGNDYDEATALAIDGNGNVYVTGTSVGSDMQQDYATIKYDADGDTIWVRRYSGTGHHDDGATALAVDDSGNVYVTGASYGFSTYFVDDYDYATIKYNAVGDTVWVHRYDGPGNSEDMATALAVDRAGNVYVTGYSYGSGTYIDFATIKYDGGGNEVWVKRYNRRLDSDDDATALAVDSSGNVYVTGYSQSRNGSLYTTIKYTQTPDGILEQPLGVPAVSKLYQNYPNPFNPTTRLSFVICHSSFVTLKVYDLLGKEVATVLNNVKYETGSYEHTFDASQLAIGVYFYRLEANSLNSATSSFVQVKKMVVVR